MNRTIFFFLGTEAELIKVFPVIIEAKNRGLDYRIIASGQNNIADSVIMKRGQFGKIDLELSKESSIKKSALGLFKWWIETYKTAKDKIEETFPEVDFKNADMVVHGDTVSTYMGAKIGNKLGMRVCHIEAGLRSHNLFSPFPEEIDRLLTSRLAVMHFAPGIEASENLKGVKGEVVNTNQNTLIDSLDFSRNVPLEGELQNVIQEEYFVFVMHRQENLANKKFVSEVMEQIVSASKNKKCVIILHEITKNTLKSMGLLNQMQENSQMILLPRVDYFDFMKLLDAATYVITDGGSNQEELYYMNKPCLIMRTTTERNEGLGENARLFNGKASDIGNFVKEYYTMRRVNTLAESQPSKLIVDAMMR